MKQDLDGYTKLSVLGRGAYSTIYLARDRAKGEICAIKQVEITSAEQARYIGHLEQEHTIASKFDHPVLRKTYKVLYSRKFIKVSSAALVMEYADGQPLSERVPSREYIRILKIFRQIASGLDHMHWRRYVHADLKPDNVIVNSEGRVKLIDYGQSFEMGQAKERVQGTVDYIAPEQVNREMLDARTDVFGLGAVMHIVFTGKPLPTMMNTSINKHTMGLVGKRVDRSDPIAQAKLPPLLAKLIQHCCQQRREDRPPNMQAVKNLIEVAMVKIHSKRLQRKQQGASAKDTDDPDVPAQAAG